VSEETRVCYQCRGELAFDVNTCPSCGASVPPPMKHFEKPVAERSPEEMCAHAKTVLANVSAIPPDELNDGDILLGQLAENVQQLVHIVPIADLRLHRARG
jgi:hypothetical protein